MTSVSTGDTLPGGRDESGRWDAYRGAVVRIDLVAGAILVEPCRAGETVGNFPFPSDTVIHVITPYDSSALDVTGNELRMIQLKDGLDDLELEWFEAVGADPDWQHREPSVAVIGLNEEDAVWIGRKYHQDAIFRWTAGAWELVDCATGVSEAMGWRCTRLAD